MEVYFIKRICLLNGHLDVSFIPAAPDDYDAIENIPKGVVIPFEVKQKRDNTKNKHLWATVKFFKEYMPHELEDELGNKSERFLYDWLKIKVGYVDKIADPESEKLYLIPRPTNFRGEKNEQKFIKDFYTPAMEYIAKLMNFTCIKELNSTAYHASQLKTRV
jgi:hypothetical protein